MENFKQSETLTISQTLTIQGDRANDATDSGNPVKIGGKAETATALTSVSAVNDRTDAKYSQQGEAYTYSSRLGFGEDSSNGLQAVQTKAVASNAYTGTPYQNNSFTTQNVKASAGCLLAVRVTNTIGSTRYLQFHNTAGTPAGGATALEKFLVPAGAQIIMGPGDLGGNGIYFSTGLAVANSTTLTTYTAGTAGDLVVDLITV